MSCSIGTWKLMLKEVQMMEALGFKEKQSFYGAVYAVYFELRSFGSETFCDLCWSAGAEKNQL